LQPIVATAPALAALTTALAGDARIALDTEFLRERTYLAQLCLVQVATAAEAVPEVAGKPHGPTAAAIEARVPRGALRVMVGDRPGTDGALAAQLGIPFALVLTGVTPPDRVPPDTGAAVIAPDLGSLVDGALHGSR